MLQLNALLAAVLHLFAAHVPATAPAAPPEQDPPGQHDLWGTVVLPGGVSAARVVLELGGDAGRVDEFLLVDFTHRFHGSSDDGAAGAAVDALRRYVALLEQITLEADALRDGIRIPAPGTPRADRDRVRKFLELLGLVLIDNDSRVEAGKSQVAKERHAWLAAAGVNTTTLLEPLNAGASVVVNVPIGELPLPLPAFWATLGARQGPILAITGSRESSLLYTGLLGVSSPTLQYLDAHRPLLAQLRSTHAAAFAAFSRSIQIRDDAVVAPGGSEGAHVWERLAGAPLSSPATFLPALLARDEGRLAYYFDTVARLDAERQAWLLGANADAIYDVFRRIVPKWKITERPFFRPAVDPLMVLSLAARERGAIVSVPWWPSLFESITNGEEFDQRDRPLDARWLLTWVFDGDGREAADRFHMFRMAQRMARGVDRAAAGHLAVLLSGVQDVPALPPALERMGITDVQLGAQLVQAARRFDPEAKGDDLASLAHWQLMFALVEQAAVRQRLPAARTGPLLRSLADWAPTTGRDTEGPAAAWLVNVFLPAMAPDAKPDDLDDLERDVLVALIKRPETEQGAQAVKVFWEGIEYVVDDTFATTRDVITIRRSQSSPTLGDVVRAYRLLRRMDAGVADMGQVAAISADFTRILGAMTKLRLRDGREIKAVTDFRRAAKAISEISDGDDVTAAVKQIPRLRAALDALVDGAVLPMVYALAVSPAGVAPASLLELPFQHTWEAGEDAAGRKGAYAWHPVQWQVGPAMEMIIRGGVLGLDVAMGHSRLRAAGRPPPAARGPVVSDTERAALFRAMRAHVEERPWGADAARVLKALDAGDAIIAGKNGVIIAGKGDAAVTEDRLRAAGIDPARIAIVQWQRDRGVPIDRLALSRLDAYRLGSAGSLGSNDALPPGWESEGTSVETEVLLELLEASRTLRFPTTLVPQLLPLAAHDLLSQVRQYSPDDVRSLREWPRTLTRERVEAYVTALVSSRVLTRPQSKK